MTRRRDEATSPLSGSMGARAPLSARVRVLDPVALARPLTVRMGERVVIGSDPESGWVLADKTVSRRHVELELVAEGVVVRDLGSRNGTFFQDQRVQEMVLSLGGSLRLGRVLIAVDVDPRSLEASAPFAADEYGKIVCRSRAMKHLAGLLARLESSLVTVLLEGESGAGKEVVAEAIHAASSRRDGRFVSINCGALPRDLVASELFGHVRGAFTGAGDARKGAFEAADGGTLFLDEVAELPLDVQPVLLRALATGEVRPVGSDRATKSHARIVAATNRDLADEVKAGRFREDLYFRLAVIKVVVPPLRERAEDLAPLARAFADELGATLSDEALATLAAQRWAGNVRELRNALQAYAILGHFPHATHPPEASLEGALRSWLDPSKPYAEQKDALLELFARDYLKALLKLTRGNVSAAAKISGLDRGWVAKLADKHGLREPD